MFFWLFVLVRPRKNNIAGKPWKYVILYRTSFFLLRLHKNKNIEKWRWNKLSCIVPMVSTTKTFRNERLFFYPKRKENQEIWIRLWSDCLRVSLPLQPYLLLYLSRRFMLRIQFKPILTVKQEQSLRLIMAVQKLKVLKKA